MCAAIPFGLIVSNFKHVDLRAIGSGNIGATNVFRALGPVYGAIVFFLDSLKGWVPTYVSIQLFEDPIIHISVGAVTIIGHTLSCFARFKGGKGAATGIGVIMALSPLVTGIILVVAICLIYITRYVALTSIACSLLAPVLFYIFGYPKHYVIVLCVIAIFIIIRHTSNIKRLLAGKENKI